MLSRLLLWLRYKITVDTYKGQSSSSSSARAAATGSFLSPQASIFVSAALAVWPVFKINTPDHNNEGF